MNLASEISKTKHYSEEFNRWLSSVSNVISSSVSFNVQKLNIGFNMSGEEHYDRLNLFASGDRAGRISIFSISEDGAYHLPIMDCITSFLGISKYEYDHVLHIATLRKKNPYENHAVLTALYDFLELVEVQYRDKVIVSANYSSCLTVKRFFEMKLSKGEACKLYKSIMALIDSKEQ